MFNFGLNPFYYVFILNCLKQVYLLFFVYGDSLNIYLFIVIYELNHFSWYYPIEERKEKVCIT